MSNQANIEKAVSAIAPSVGSIGTMTAIEVDCTGGFDRVKYTLNLGTATASGLIDMKIQDSVLGGGSYSGADISGAALTQVTKANGDGKVYVIDVKINPARPYQKAVVVVTTAAFPNSVTATLYQGSRSFPVPVPSGVQVVIV